MGGGLRDGRQKAARARLALRLRAQGLTYKQIGKYIGLSQGRAREVVWDGLRQSMPMQEWMATPHRELRNMLAPHGGARHVKQVTCHN